MIFKTKNYLGNPFRTHVSVRASSWLDDFKYWADNDENDCCRYFPSNNSFCPHTANNSLCHSCAFSKVNLSRYDYYRKYLPHFLNDNADAFCAKGGHEAYASVRILCCCSISVFQDWNYMLNIYIVAHHKDILCGTFNNKIIASSMFKI